MSNDEAVLWDDIAIDVMLPANHSITDMTEGTVNLKGSLAAVSVTKAGSDQGFELDVTLLDHEANDLLR